MQAIKILFAFYLFMKWVYSYESEAHAFVLHLVQLTNPTRDHVL